MQEFYIGQKFHYYVGNNIVSAKLIKIDGDTLYFRKNNGECFKGLKYFVGHTIFIDNRAKEIGESTNKKARAKTKKSSQYIATGKHVSPRTRDRNRRLETYWDNFGKSGTQKDID